MRPVLVDSLFEGLAVARRLSAPEAALGSDAEAGPREPANVCEPGDVLGGVYRVERLIGKGGMGEVYEVEHRRLRARFAAKVLRAGSDPWPDAVRRFRREAAALAAMRSDHVVRARLSLLLEQSASVWVWGAAGAGKSTLLRMHFGSAANAATHRLAPLDRDPARLFEHVAALLPIHGESIAAFPGVPLADPVAFSRYFWKRFWSLASRRGHE